MYLLIDDHGTTEYETLDQMAYAEHERAPRLVGQVHRVARSVRGVRLLDDREAEYYRFLLDEAVGMWTEEVRFEPTEAGRLHAREIYARNVGGEWGNV